jgi:hypothetical protein
MQTIDNSFPDVTTTYFRIHLTISNRSFRSFTGNTDMFSFFIISHIPNPLFTCCLSLVFLDKYPLLRDEAILIRVGCHLWMRMKMKKGN